MQEVQLFRSYVGIDIRVQFFHDPAVEGAKLFFVLPVISVRALQVLFFPVFSIFFIRSCLPTGTPGRSVPVFLRLLMDFLLIGAVFTVRCPDSLFIVRILSPVAGCLQDFDHAAELADAQDRFHDLQLYLADPAVIIRQYGRADPVFEPVPFRGQVQHFRPQAHDL